MQRKLQKKKTNTIAFVQERDAIIEGINAGLADVKAGRVYTHEQVMIHIAQKFESLRRRTIIDFIGEVGASNIDPKVDWKELHYQEKPKKYSFGEKTLVGKTPGFD